MGILGHLARHGDGALGKFGQRRLAAVSRGNDGLALADEDAQTDIAAFGALDLLGLAEAEGDREGGAFDHHRVGGVGAGLLGLAQQGVEGGKQLGVRHNSAHFQIGLPEPGRPRSGQRAVTLSMTSWSMRICRPHSRWVSGGILSVASIPSFPPRPDSGEAKSR